MANAERPTQPETQVQPEAQSPVRVARFGGTFSGPLGTVTTEVTQPASETQRNVGHGVLAGVAQYFFRGTRLKRDADVAVTTQASMELPLGLTVQTSLDLSQADVARVQAIALASAGETVAEAWERRTYDRVAAPTETRVVVAVTTFWGWLRMERGTNATMAHQIVEQVTRDTAERETIRQLTATGDAVTATVKAVGQAITNPQPPSREEGIQLACRFC